MSKDRRYTLTIKLNPTGDNDLIQWYENIPDGERNQTVKTALRVSLDLPIPAPPPPPEVEALRHQLEAQRQLASDQIEALRLEVERWQAAANGNSESAERLTYLESWMEQMAGAYNGLVQRVDTLGHLPAAAIQDNAPVEVSPQMTTDEQTQRASKLKKASW